MLLKPALAGLLSLAQCIHGTLLGKLDSVPDCVDTIAHFSLQQYCSISVSASGNVNVAFKIDVNQSVNVPAPLQGFSQTTIQQGRTFSFEIYSDFALSVLNYRRGSWSTGADRRISTTISDRYVRMEMYGCS